MNRGLTLSYAFLLALVAAACSEPAMTTQSGNEAFAWSSVNVTEGEDPHAYGFEVQLWRHDGALIGFMNEYVGPVSDPPAGKLEALVFNERTGEISFNARLTTGVVHSERTGNWVPSKNLYEFRGVIAAEGALTGTLRRILIQDDGKTTASQESVVFKRAEVDVKPYKEWQESWEEALKFRGPKW